MESIKDASFGVIPVYKNNDSTYLYCVVRHAVGHWAFPKGHKEKGESDEEVARRELREETGNEVKEIAQSVNFIENYSFERAGATHEKIVKYYLGIVPSMSTATQTAYKNEIVEIEWLPYDELLKRLTFPEGKRIAKEANDFLMTEA